MEVLPFSLSDRRADRILQFKVRLKGMKPLQIKIHLNAVRLQFADSAKTVDRIAPKAAYTLCQNQFDLTVNAVFYHALKF